MPRFGRRPAQEPADSEAPEQEPQESQEVSRPQRAQIPFSVSLPTTFAILGLVALTAFVLLLNQGALPAAVITWWPLVVLVFSLLWFLSSLVRRDSRSLLGSAALLGLSVSMMLAAQNVASLAGTMVGVMFIATGTAIVLRGLLLRQQPIS
jgi:hypothetical protein